MCYHRRKAKMVCPYWTLTKEIKTKYCYDKAYKEVHPSKWISETLHYTYLTTIHLTYCITVWGGVSDSSSCWGMDCQVQRMGTSPVHSPGGVSDYKLAKVFSLQKRSVRLLFGSNLTFDHAEYYMTCVLEHEHTLNTKKQKTKCVRLSWAKLQ